ncbi:type II toxin-antitoxin system VapC family toxin [Dictyoglomus thermophilum]|uniref:type II toxin-antitoxin system VapC family toxin n=1 Tax=Dictyoglomus thermophilum TaxID=14 RepID=UPI0011EB3602|nr:type II toxin-antitoxin system VapC family toxin [Dictyoglomus thermophilum]TYT23347.1 type II toxin-antitoxin system VapC family toxin [Dictyoglomus thermophilum]
MKFLTLDSSIIIAALREQEEKHNICLEVLEKIKNGEYIAIEPYTVLIEVTAAIRRRTGSKKLAEKVRFYLRDIDSIHFLELESYRAEEASRVAEELSVRGMDAVVIQIAKEFNSVLLTLDNEMAEKAKGFVYVGRIEEFL